MAKINDKQFEYHKFEKMKQSVKCYVSCHDHVHSIKEQGGGKEFAKLVFDRKPA